MRYALACDDRAEAVTFLLWIATLLSAGVCAVLQKALKLNFIAPKPFIFELDTNTEKDEKLQADTYAVLSNMGVQIPIEHLEKTFKINGLKYRENYGFGGNFGFNPAQNAQNALKFSPNSQNAPQFSLNATAKSPANELKNALLNKAQSLHLSEFDKFFADFEEQNADFDFEKFKGIFEGASSFEDAEQQLVTQFKKEEIEKCEALLMQLVANADIFGKDL